MHAWFDRYVRYDKLVRQLQCEQDPSLCHTIEEAADSKVLRVVAEKTPPASALDKSPPNLSKAKHGKGRRTH